MLNVVEMLIKNFVLDEQYVTIPIIALEKDQVIICGILSNTNSDNHKALDLFLAHTKRQLLLIRRLVATSYRSMIKEINYGKEINDFI